MNTLIQFSFSIKMTETQNCTMATLENTRYRTICKIYSNNCSIMKEKPNP
jgi:hypothetical protein